MTEKNDEIKAAVTMLNMWLSRKRKFFTVMIAMTFIINLIMMTMVKTDEQFGVTLLALLLIQVLHFYFQNDVTKEIAKCLRALEKLGMSARDIAEYNRKNKW